MVRYARLLAAASLIAGGTTPLLAATGPSDAEIAHIAYTAGALDAAAARQALAKTQNPQVRAFAEVILRDHEAVNGKALALVNQLKVTPADNATSQALANSASGIKEGAQFSIPTMR